MAVLTQRPPPRLSISGTRLRRTIAIVAAALALAGACPLMLHAQDGSALTAGAASFTAGKYDLAVRQLTAAINSEGLSPENTAKALYYRGLAYQRQGNSPRAISDLGAAIWLGLGSSDRVSAMVNRGLAYRAAGLSSEAEAEIAAARKAGGSGAVDQLLAQSGTSSRETAAISAFTTQVQAEASRPAPAPPPQAARETPAAPPPQATASASPGSWSTTTAAEGQSSGGNRLTRWWGSWRGSSSEPEAAPQAAPPPAAPPPQATASWTTRTEVAQSDAAPATPSSGERYAAAEPSAAAPAGNFRLQLSPTRSEAEAMALWKQVASQNQQIAAMRPAVEKTDMGNLGTFYRLQIGPFPDKAESLKVCNALKRSGVDCFLVTP
jgi:hypothetical protein